MPLSPKAAAARLGLSVGRVRQLIASGALRAVNVGVDRPLWAIEETELARFAALDRPGHRPRKETTMNDLERRQDRREQINHEATAMSDQELIAAAAPIVRRDLETIAMGGRGLINESEWEYVFVARSRGLSI
jgi:excisionase family DNA binding protein